jgi:hypothetical protein
VVRVYKGHKHRDEMTNTSNKKASSALLAFVDQPAGYI